MQLSVKEVEDQLKEFQKIIHEYRSADIQFQKTTKEQFIKKLIEKTDILIQAGSFPKLQRKDISSFLYSELRKNEIDISDRYIQKFCTDEQKRNYSQSEIISEKHKHDFILEVDGGVLGLLLQCQCGKFSNGSQELEFITPENKEETPEERIEREKRQENYKLDKIDELILMRSGNAHHNGKLWLKIYEARRDYPEIRSKLDPLLGDIADLTKAEKGLAAKYETFDGMVDMREKLHLAEILRLNMMMFDYNLAKVASLLDLSAKWMHHVNKRVSGGKDSEELMRIVKMIHNCPSCGWEGYSKWMSENEKRIQKGLEVIAPEKKELCCITCKNSMK